MRRGAGENGTKTMASKKRNTGPSNTCGRGANGADLTVVLLTGVVRAVEMTAMVLTVVGLSERHWVGSGEAQQGSTLEACRGLITDAIEWLQQVRT
jgi:hypothetical protein